MQIKREKLKGVLHVLLDSQFPGGEHGCYAGSLMACHVSEGDGGKHVYRGFCGKEKAWQDKAAEGWLVCIISAGSGA